MSGPRSPRPPSFDGLVVATVLFLAVTLIAVEVHTARQGAAAAKAQAAPATPVLCDECGAGHFLGKEPGTP